MSSVIDFYSKLPKGNATQKASGIKGKYFDGQNSSRTPLLATIGGLFLIGYTLDCEFLFLALVTCSYSFFRST